VDERRAAVLDRLAESETFGKEQTLDELQQVASDCRAANWDGYGAAPVTQEAVAQAEAFLRALPLGMRGPSVGVEPDGHLTFEWYHSPSWSLSVSVSPNGWLHYAALLGSSSEYGAVPFLGQLPRAIHDLVTRTLSA
jgi:hypothetical protein